jgi:hypothetical protein
MKHLYTFLFLVCFLNHTQAQDTTPPEAINDLEVIHELSDEYQDGGATSFFNFSWTIPYDESTIVSYKIYNYDQYFTEFTCDNCDFYSLLILELNTDFCIRIAAVDDSGNEALLSNEVCLNSNYYYKELFISQYYENGNNNKAIELSINPYSFDEVINLSEYDLRINTNGGASWSSPLPLSGNFSQDYMYLNSYVIINSNATDTNLISEADLSTNSEVLQFDGNDPIGLFKNGQLVDIVGNFNGGNNYFAQNVNLQRRPCIVNIASATPSPVSYIPSDWIDDNYAECQNTFVNPIGIGVYSPCCLLSIEDITLETFKVHPNPITHSELKLTHSTPIYLNNIELYDINGKHIASFKMNYINNQFLLDLPHLSKGVYFLKIFADNKSVTKKLIKN